MLKPKACSFISKVTCQPCRPFLFFEMNLDIEALTTAPYDIQAVADAASAGISRSSWLSEAKKIFKVAVRNLQWNYRSCRIRLQIVVLLHFLRQFPLELTVGDKEVFQVIIKT